jgi:hypothetical protein
LESFEQSALDRAEKARHALDIQNVRELIGAASRRVRAKGEVGDLNERRLIRWITQDAIQFGLLSSLVRRLQFDRALLQLTRKRDRALDQCRRMDLFLSHS